MRAINGVNYWKAVVVFLAAFSMTVSSGVAPMARASGDKGGAQRGPYQIGSGNTAIADPPVPRPKTKRRPTKKANPVKKGARAGKPTGEPNTERANKKADVILRPANPSTTVRRQREIDRLVREDRHTGNASPRRHDQLGWEKAGRSKVSVEEWLVMSCVMMPARRLIVAIVSRLISARSSRCVPDSSARTYA